LNNIQIIVSTHAVLADALTHGFVKMLDLALLVFDEGMPSYVPDVIRIHLPLTLADTMSPFNKLITALEDIRRTESCKPSTTHSWKRGTATWYLIYWAYQQAQSRDQKYPSLSQCFQSDDIQYDIQ
jgi:hypothetical protein